MQNYKGFDSILSQTLITGFNTDHKFVKMFIKVFLLYVQNLTKKCEPLPQMKTTLSLYSRLR